MSELFPNNLQAAQDPGLIAGNIMNQVVVTAETVKTLRGAFDYCASDTWLLHADKRAQGAVSTFVTITMGILAEVAKTRPDLIDNQSSLLRNVSQKYHNLDHRVGGQAPSYLYGYPNDDPEKATRSKQEFLIGASAYIARARATSDTAYAFHWLASGAFDLLGESLANGEGIAIDGNTALAESIQHALDTQEQDLSSIREQRTRVLRNTLLNPEATHKNFERAELTRGDSFQIDLDNVEPLLDAQQTHTAFFARSRTDAGALQARGIAGSVVAQLEAGDNIYMIVDPRATQREWFGNASGSGTHTESYRDESKTGQLKVLQILRQDEDLRHGYAVIESDYDFVGKYSSPRYPIRDFSSPSTTGAYKPAPETGVEIQIDRKGRLVLHGVSDGSAFITAARGVLSEARPERLSPKETIQYQLGEVRRILADCMIGGRSSYPWAPDMLKDLDTRCAEQLRESSGEQEQVMSVRTSADLLNPHIWRNQHGEMDAVNLFLSNFGAVSRDQVLGIIQGIHAQDSRSTNGVVTFRTGTPGVTTKIKYGFSDGVVKYIQPEIAIDPSVEISAS